VVAQILPDNAILIARNLGPADILEYDRTKLRGILLEEGSAASHAAIATRGSSRLRRLNRRRAARA
jgi:phosphotransferase system enzyme I (PtsP)